MPDGILIYGDQSIEKRQLERPSVPRAEVIDELYAAVMDGVAPIHSGVWAKGTLEICLAMLESSASGADVPL